MNLQQTRMAKAASVGFSTIWYVTDPERWPEFAAYAEQHVGGTWTEADRIGMQADGRLLWKLYETLEAL